MHFSLIRESLQFNALKLVTIAELCEMKQFLSCLLSVLLSALTFEMVLLLISCG